MSLLNSLSQLARQHAKSWHILARLAEAAFIVWIALVYGFYVFQFVSEPVLTDRLLALLSSLLR